MQVLLVDIHPHSDPVTPISLANLAAVLRREGHPTELLSISSGRPASPAGLRRALSELGPKLVGFTAYQRNLSQVRAVARMARQASPGCRTLIGGPQAVFLPDRALAELQEIDIVCHGEGELVIREAVRAIDEDALDRPIPGATTRQDGDGWLRGAAPSPPEDLDAYPSPWLDSILDPADWEESILLTSRGCPHHCSFCVTPAAFGTSIRAHSVERVLDDISAVASRGSGRLWFADPNFSYDADRVAAILDGIARRGLKVEMWIETRADMLTPDLLRMLHRAGAHTVALGLESAVPAVLARTGKAVDPEAIGTAARTALAAGLDVELFSQYGLPGETVDDALSTLAFVRSCGVAVRGNSNAQQMQLYFGSSLLRNPEAHGIRPLRGDLPPYLAPGDEFETDWMCRADMDRVRAAWTAASVDGGKRIVS
jgi:anaerobic magnesium-protoporphyrin IX monomethyl ester cyclase